MTWIDIRLVDNDIVGTQIGYRYSFVSYHSLSGPDIIKEFETFDFENF